MRLRSIILACALTLGVLTAAPAQATTPAVTWSANSLSTVYPIVDGYKDKITFSWALDQPVNSQTLRVLDATQQPVFELALDASVSSYQWNGRTTAGALAPAGTYTPELSADNGVDPVVPSAGGNFSLSLKKLVAKTWTKRVTASGSLRSKFVGACSTLAKPGKKLGSGSLGYYSLTKCSRTTNGADTIATVHGLTLPSAFRPGNLQISTYSGAVKSGSNAVLVPLAKNGSDVIDAAVSLLGSSKGWHAGKWTAATPMMTSSRLVRWGVAAFNGTRYDVKYFKVTYRYTALV